MGFADIFRRALGTKTAADFATAHASAVDALAEAERAYLVDASSSNWKRIKELEEVVAQTETLEKRAIEKAESDAQAAATKRRAAAAARLAHLEASQSSAELRTRNAKLLARIGALVGEVAAVHADLEAANLAESVTLNERRQLMQELGLPNPSGVWAEDLLMVVAGTMPSSPTSNMLLQHLRMPGTRTISPEEREVSRKEAAEYAAWLARVNREAEEAKADGLADHMSSVKGWANQEPSAFEVIADQLHEEARGV